MRRYLYRSCGLLVLSLLLTPSLAGAQAPNPPAPPNVAPPHPTPDPQSASAPVTLTGCLQRPQAAAPGQDAATRTTPASAFVLRTAGTDGKPGVVYHLVSSAKEIDLARHLNHRVEITGTLRPATNQQPAASNHGVSPSTPSGSTGMETMPPPSGEAVSPHKKHGSTSVAQPLFVTSLRMIDAQCAAPTE